MIRTAESCSPKHPDKLCDQISDAILDACLRQDPYSRVAIETMGGHGIITITGELTTKAYVNMREIALRVAPGNGVQINVVRQSPEIAQGVDGGGAGDQGIMVGYACNETPELMPLEVMLAREICQAVYVKFPEDGKTQVTLEDGELISLVVSFANTDAGDLAPIINEFLTKHNAMDCKIYDNPAGIWTQSGFEADTGLTGRKLIVDNYGPRIPIGGGAFSGKDPSKVDRTAAYMARKIAVDLLKKNDAVEVIVNLAYVIGKKEPVQVDALIVRDVIEDLGRPWGKMKDDLTNDYDLTPNGIIRFLDLKKPQYEETAKWGHMGNGFTWDK